MNPFTDESRGPRWEAGLPELGMQQLRAPSSLDWLRHDGKPAERPLSTHLLKCAFDAALIAMILAGNYRGAILRLVTTWPELLTWVSQEVKTAASRTVVSKPDNGQRRPLAKVTAR